MGRLVADLAIDFDTLERVITDLRIEPAMRLNGTPYYGTLDVDRMRVELNSRKEHANAKR